jgi:uncharacterized membrane protein
MDLTQFKDEQKKIRKEVMGKMVASLLAAFGFVLALAWNDAIKSTIENFFPVGSGGLTTKFVYAVLLTVAIAIAGYYISKATAKKEGE